MDTPGRHCLLTCMVLLPVAAAAHAESQLGDLTGPWQLFVDDYAVGEKQGVTRTYHEFSRYVGNPVIVGDRTWEDDNVYLYGSVLPAESGGGYRMWYHCLDLTNGTARSLYATSTDGITWEKPDLGIIPFGSLPTNLFMNRGGNPSVIHTP